MMTVSFVIATDGTSAIRMPHILGSRCNSRQALDIFDPPFLGVRAFS